MSQHTTITSLLHSTMATEDFATAVGLKSQTIRKTYCLKGEVMGIRPVKLPNGKLRWSTQAIADLLKGGAA